MLHAILLAGAAAPCLPPATSAAALSPCPDDIVVTATRAPQPLATVSASVTVVSRQDIANTPARTIDDVLRHVPSIDLPLTSTNAQHPTNTIVSMRGLSGIRSLVLLDGVPLNDSFFGYVQWSEVPLATVDRVEVVRGGGAALWGNYAMGGVVNILTRPIDRSGIDAEAAGGNRGTYRLAAQGALAGTGYGIGLSGGIDHTNGYVEQAEGYRGPIVVPTSSTTRNAAVSANIALSPRLDVRGRATLYDNDQNFLTRLQTNEQRNWRYSASVAWRPDDATEVELNGFHVDERFVTNNTGAPAGIDPTQAEYVQNRHLTRAHDSGASLTWRRSFAGPLRALSTGIDYHGVSGSDRAAILDANGNLVRTDVGAGKQRFLGSFVQAELRPADPMQVQLTLRYQDFLNYGGIDAAPGGVGSVPSRHDGSLDPRVSIRYDLSHVLGFNGAFYRAFRAPTLDNLYRSASVPGYILFSNAALAPETLTGGEIGLSLDRGPTRARATVYSSVISDFLTYRYLDPATLPAGFDVGARLINAGRARSRGVELEARWQVLPQLSFDTSYVFADSIVTRNPEDPASVGVQQPGIPRHRIDVGLDWVSAGGVRVSPRVRYVSSTNGDPDDLFRTDAHVVADLAASAPVQRGFEVIGQIENLFARRYIATNDGFTAPLYGTPFTAMVGVRVRIGER